jgi:hypothetical protein
MFLIHIGSSLPFTVPGSISGISSDVGVGVGGIGVGGESSRGVCTGVWCIGRCIVGGCSYVWRSWCSDQGSRVGEKLSLVSHLTSSHNSQQESKKTGNLKSRISMVKWINLILKSAKVYLYTYEELHF